QPGVVGWKRELADDPFRELRLVRVKHAGADANPNLFAQRTLGAQLLRSPGGVGGHRLADGLNGMQALTEGPAAADLLFRLWLVFQIEPWHAAPLPGGFLQHNAMPLAQSPSIGLGEIPGGLDSRHGQMLFYPPAHAPHLINWHLP